MYVWLAPDAQRIAPQLRAHCPHIRTLWFTWAAEDETPMRTLTSPRSSASLLGGPSHTGSRL